MNEYPEKREDWEAYPRSTACYEREIAELKKQRDALLDACRFALDNIDKSFSEKAEAKARLKAAIAQGKE